MATIPSVVREITLVGEQIFDHTQVVRAEIDRFVERFERNERHREFDGILRASHALVESSETPVEGLFDMGKMEHMTQCVDDITKKLQTLVEPKYQKEHDVYLEKVKEDQKKYVDVCREQAMNKMRSMTAHR
ncbi:Biogenesis of lysosome-related organelles complex 1 subunit 5 [Caenorhabditis elegans]|uniref:Biogenesis of lysosome-related organelles complex 1 subunit 5 n=1 Tax=Caenorhabditis elegans TaxID=6239 RepID=BL1S5_CAEEL|nr:Biogenesis of lysosome-related organelles complex 1 subunit 5 [Caenorhabditis elegans]Q18446.2 RecName: Full=Biogenesis of lysosome-related organelles complex 1 subunit 5; Short=BLOC-1 subunit 5; AltName: Full=Protein Muted homolog [Caenorhabditis elegans]CCD66607.1 Biogenesis of lysosome-related organelles complex 1 subunit 5 [Caenorhabditis elegans]|eukprot:NP_501119.2 Biogenesis of lysosome-related organelles complex 1 subunit 5 [Caenorhabditis elegans]